MQHDPERIAELGMTAGAEVKFLPAARMEPSAEMRRRINELLAAPLPALQGEALRELRAVEILERIANADARALLAALAAGAPEARLTREAKLSRARLEQQRREQR